MNKNQANSISFILKKSLGENWQIKVFENVGWHVTAYNGVLSVSGKRDGSSGRVTYTCLMSNNLDHQNAGFPLWTSESPECHETHPIFTDPKEAVLYQLRIARQIVNRLETVVSTSEAIVKDWACECCGRKYEL